MNRLLIVAIAAILANSVFAAVCGVIWPVHQPAWVQRVFAVAWLAGLLVALGTGLLYLRRERRK